MEHRTYLRLVSEVFKLHKSWTIFLFQVGGVKCWTGERLVSPLLLCNTHPQYRDWCRVKLDQDPDCVLESGYVQGTVFSRPSSSTSAK